MLKRIWKKNRQGKDYLNKRHYNVKLKKIKL